MFDVRTVRADFPVLRRLVNGKPLVYLDNAATSQKPRSVIDALVEYYEQYNSNIHRGVHALSQESTDAYERVRQQTARFINAAVASEVIFVRNTTEAINLVARAWAGKYLLPGDEIVVSEAEHHSNLIPWQQIVAEKGAGLRVIPITDEGELDIDAAARLIGPRTKLVAVAHMGNVLGTINPVAELARLAHGVGALMLVDGAQSVPHFPVDVQSLGCDFLAFSSHKMLGPTGIGVLYARQELLEQMDPYQTGGSMIRSVRLDRATWAEVPQKFEAGTPNIADTIAFGAAIEYLEQLGMANVLKHEQQLTAYALEALGDLEGMRVFGPRDPAKRGGVLSFWYADIHPHDIGTVVDQDGVAVRAGHHCAQPLMRRLGVPATVRASLYVYNTAEEVDVLVQALKKTKELFSGVGTR